MSSSPAATAVTFIKRAKHVSAANPSQIQAYVTLARTCHLVTPTCKGHGEDGDLAFPAMTSCQGRRRWEGLVARSGSIEATLASKSWEATCLLAQCAGLDPGIPELPALLWGFSLDSTPRLASLAQPCSSLTAQLSAYSVPTQTPPWCPAQALPQHVRPSLDCGLFWGRYGVSVVFLSFQA